MGSWGKDEGQGEYRYDERRKHFGFLLCGILAYAVAVFLFSIIFWRTHRWMIKKR